MKTVLLLMILVGTASAETAPDRKVRVALALSGHCGVCSSDLDACRTEALRKHVPLVIFIGGCEGRAKELGGGAVYCRQKEYRVEGTPVEGIVVLGELPAKKDTLFILKQLPKDSPTEEILDSIRQAKGTVKLDWLVK